MMDVDKFYINEQNDELIQIHPDGSWTVKHQYYGDDKVYVETTYFSAEDVAEREKHGKKYGSVGFKNYSHSGNSIAFWDDRDHELICTVEEIPADVFDDFGTKCMFDKCGKLKSHWNLLNDCELIRNIDQLHTTEIGQERIRRNLGLRDGDVVEWCRNQILDNSASIKREGKNWYVRIAGCVFTVNASSYTIITAHRDK